ncbi:tellurium resistance protein TerC [Psychrosphaera ytuae]|uniref:Tellurium resistance protein TerC n=1 Tax=Psychrosphaera ytuae TaxID=2820710 RepID=A0A975HH95_9GAMM|nr:PGPGW domain-containing protein [Psychrosphaera ytuae]QTH62803.1 tellurium resistance protein TerC [Psychrosphaera ytuae]
MLRTVRFLFINIVGGLLVLLGLVFIIIPGPSLLLLIPGLFILSYEYDVAKDWLKKCQNLLSVSARWLDAKIAMWKGRKH